MCFLHCDGSLPSLTNDDLVWNATRRVVATAPQRDMHIFARLDLEFEGQTFRPEPEVVVVMRVGRHHSVGIT